MGMTLLLQTNIQCKNDEHIHIKVFLKNLKDHLKGMSGRESELPEDNVSADGIASAVGSISDSPDSSSIFCFSCPWADVEGAVDGADSVF